MNIKELVLKILKIPLSGIVNFLLKNLNIFIIYRIGEAIGDQLCITAVVRLIHQQYPFKIVVISSYPEIFYNNPRVWKNIGVKKNRYYLSRVLRQLSGAQLENFLFNNSKVTYVNFMRLNGHDIHLTQAHSLHFKHSINFNEIENYNDQNGKPEILRTKKIDQLIKELFTVKDYQINLSITDDAGIAQAIVILSKLI